MKQVPLSIINKENQSTQKLAKRIWIISILAFVMISSTIMANVACSYETVLIDFPPREDWRAILHEKQGYESILQYVPRGQDATNWTRTLIFHSYKKGGLAYSNAAELLNMTTAQLEYQNNSSQYKYIKYEGADSVATRCVQGNANIGTQCEILRTSNSFEGLISMHYINKDVKNFKTNYKQWMNIIRKITIYQSHFRDNRIMDKEQNFEL